jgi:hypothetical protein
MKGYDPMEVVLRSIDDLAAGNRAGVLIDHIDAVLIARFEILLMASSKYHRYH